LGELPQDSEKKNGHQQGPRELLLNVLHAGESCRTQRRDVALKSNEEHDDTGSGPVTVHYIVTCSLYMCNVILTPLGELPQDSKKKKGHQKGPRELLVNVSHADESFRMQRRVAATKNNEERDDTGSGPVTVHYIITSSLHLYFL
jgi:hypothetical protein